MVKGSNISIFLDNIRCYIPIIMNWLGCEGLRLVQALNDETKRKCTTNAELFETLSEKFK